MKKIVLASLLLNFMAFPHGTIKKYIRSHSLIFFRKKSDQQPNETQQRVMMQQALMDQVFKNLVSDALQQLRTSDKVTQQLELPFFAPPKSLIVKAKKGALVYSLQYDITRTKEVTGGNIPYIFEAAKL